jgi:predicted DNA-binding WGR domain protein
MKRTTKDMRPRGYTAVQLRRVDKARNMARFCCLTVQQNLFGVWWFVREFGRIGSPGRVMQPPYPPLNEAVAAHAKLWKSKLKWGYSAPA